MKRRYANQVEGDYSQKRIDEDYFKGYVCNIKIKGISKPYIVNNGITEICIKDENYEWFEVYPDNENYVITIMFDDNKNLVEWYFDISKNIGIENGIPYEDDLYLDIIIMPDGQKIIMDEDELTDALNREEITQTDFELAYQTLKKIEIKYVKELDNLIDLTNSFCKVFNSNSKINN